MRQEVGNSSRIEYHLTPAGESLSSVVFGMADWSQEWLQIEPALENLDADHLMWSLRRSARSHPDLPNPFVVNFFLHDQAKEHRNSWLVFKGKEVELCIVDHDFEVDVQVIASTENLTKVFMGWIPFGEAIKNGKLKLLGPKRYTDMADQWLGHSRLANIHKQPEELRVS